MFEQERSNNVSLLYLDFAIQKPLLYTLILVLDEKEEVWQFNIIFAIIDKL